MKTKTIIELLTLSSTLYYLAKDTELLDRLNQFSDKGKDNINKLMSEPLTDENGNQLEFIDRIIYKTHQLKEELNEKIEQQVVMLYKKINIAHLDDLKALHTKIEDLDATIALLEARLNRLES